MSERAQRIALALQAADVRLLAGVTGGGFSLQLIDAWMGLGLPYLPACHEGAAAIIAGAHAHVTGTLGAVVTIKGPGVANLVPGQVSNAYEGWRVISVSEAYGPQRAGRAHKWLNHPGLMTDIVRGLGAFGDPDSTVQNAAAAATREIPGPVHLDVPPDGPGSWSVPPPDRRTSDDDAEAGAALRQAKRPIVILGSAASRRGWLRDVAWRCPVFTTFAAKGAIDERHPSAAGVFTGDGQMAAPERVLLPHADLVIGVGLRNTEILTPRPFPCPLVNLDDVSASQSSGFGGLNVSTGDDGDRVRDVLADVAAWGTDETAAAHETVWSQLTAGGWTPARALRALQAALPEARLVVDTGLFCTAAEHVWRAARIGDVLASANGRFMGTSIPMAVGAALAEPSRPVLCVVGDGGFPPALAELRACLTRRLPVLVVLMTDGRFGSVIGPPGARGRAEEAATVRPASWIKMMEAFGCAVARADELDGLERALATWDRRGPMFIELPFDPATYARSTEGVR